MEGCAQNLQLCGQTARNHLKQLNPQQLLQINQQTIQKMKPELSNTARSFASDLAQLPEWNGPKKLDNFDEQDWVNFADYVRRDDGSLSADDIVLCDEIAEAIENA